MNERDTRMYKALLLVLSKGSFNVEWREAPALYVLQKWIEELPERLTPKVEPPKPKRTRKKKSNGN